MQIIRINPETQRISLGMKQLDKDPWEGVGAKYPLGAKVKGRVTNITDYGAFVELEDGIEGLVHVSEMSWTKKNVHPGKILSTSEEIKVQVLEVDPSKRRISLGLKQSQDNPWESFAEKYPTGTDRRRRDQEHHRIRPVRRPRRRRRRHGASLRPRLEEGRRRGDQGLQEGRHVKAQVLDVDIEKERISLGIKQVAGDPDGADLPASRRAIPSPAKSRPSRRTASM